MKTNQYLTIHGHFYQPPRENPWIESIERQESAAPYHDWNERIAVECYTPNYVSRILDGQGRIIDIVNNYKRMSFNFGPTLMSWLAQKSPETYQEIIDADRESVEQCSGHGNAIAQAYNHIILPLANYRDKVTQVKWGLTDFEYRFKRPSEAIWLPETAVNDDTLKVLINFGIKFIILSPFQAKRVRQLDTNNPVSWQDVSNGSIDVRQPYRCFLIDKNGKKPASKYIDIFFYHGGLSNAVGFQHILRDAKIFADQIQKAYPDGEHQNQLISVCTDGESYGHHEPFGDMALAYLLYVEAERRGFQITNYAEFLAKNPPQWEVELKEGPKGEGTAWSCFHGVGRWYRDCGCSTGGLPSWNQKWREPLRAAIDYLRDDLITLFEEEGSKYLKDVWEARNDYIEVIFQRDESTIQRFLEKHGLSSSVFDHKGEVLNLLESQRNAMLMYTSCGWFFSDISGIETVQVLRYAARAIELAHYFGYDELEKKFVTTLQQAKSNLPLHKDGARIYYNLVKPFIVTFPKIVNHFAILTSFKEFEAVRSIYHYTIDQFEKEGLSLNQQKCEISRVRVTSGVTLDTREFVYLLSHPGYLDYQCYVKSITDEADYQKLKTGVRALLGERASQLLRFIQQDWFDDQFTLQDMLFEEREEFFAIILREKLTPLQKIYQKIYKENEMLFPAMLKIGITIPQELKTPAEATLSAQLVHEIERSKHDFDKKFYKRALSVIEKSEKYGFHLNKVLPENIFNDILQRRFQQLYHHPVLQTCNELIKILEITNNLKIKVKEGHFQNILFKILREKLPQLIDKILADNVVDERFQLVTSIIQLALRLNFSTSIYKQKLRALDKKISDDPNIWP